MKEVSQVKKNLKQDRTDEEGKVTEEKVLSKQILQKQKVKERQRDQGVYHSSAVKATKIINLMKHSASSIYGSPLILTKLIRQKKKKRNKI